MITTNIFAAAATAGFAGRFAQSHPPTDGDTLKIHGVAILVSLVWIPIVFYLDQMIGGKVDFTSSAIETAFVVFLAYPTGLAFGYLGEFLEDLGL